MMMRMTTMMTLLQLTPKIVLMTIAAAASPSTTGAPCTAADAIAAAAWSSSPLRSACLDRNARREEMRALADMSTGGAAVLNCRMRQPGRIREG